MGANSNNKTSENRPILLLFGEGDFSFSKTLIELNNYQDYDIIATEFRKENELQGYPNFQDNIRIVRTSPNFKILFGVDIMTCNWDDIYTRVYGKTSDQIPQVDIIQFNFPWFTYPPPNPYGTVDLINRFFEFGRNNLKSDGELKLAINYESADYVRIKYGINDLTRINGFEHIGNQNIHTDFRGYQHVSSMPDKIIPGIQQTGILITYKLSE